MNQLVRTGPVSGLKGRHISFWMFTGFLVTVFILAYVGLIPRNIKAIPFYDSIGHFVLYGLWALLLDRALQNKNVVMGSVSIPLAIIVMVGIGTSEELLQSVSALRTVSLTDWVWGISGIILFVLTFRLVSDRSGGSRV